MIRFQKTEEEEIEETNNNNRKSDLKQKKTPVDPALKIILFTPNIVNKAAAYYQKFLQT